MKHLFEFRTRGTDLDTFKDLTKNKAIEEASVPEYLYFPLDMHIGAPSEVTVEIGDRVLVGSQLAQDSDAISANIISSVSGEVVDIGPYPSIGGQVDCVVVKNDYLDECDQPLFDLDQVDQLSSDEKKEIIRKAGIVGMGGATFPSDVKLQTDELIDTILINGAECEPFSTADYRLMIEKADEIAMGAQYVQSLFPGSQVYIGIEHQNKDCIQAMSQAIADKASMEIAILDDLYPQGAEQMLIENVTGREVPPAGLPADVNCIVKNVGTVRAIYQCLAHGRPLISRVTTVSGSPLHESKNLNVRIGTRIQSLIEDCGGFDSTPSKIIHGGPMMGVSILTGFIPITKGSSVISILNKEQNLRHQRTDCIRCAECINVCPVNLQPILISNAYEHGDIEKAKELGAMDCIECGNCSYICPSHIPLLDNIKKAKKAIQIQEQDD